MGITSSFSRFDFIFSSRYRLSRIRCILDGRKGKGRRKLVSGAYNQEDLTQDRGDLINIEEILRGLGSDYSFEEIFRGETGRWGGRQLFLREEGGKARRKKRPWRRERKKRKTQDEGRNSDQLFPPRGLVEYAWNNRISHAISRGKSFSFVSFSTCSRLFSPTCSSLPPSRSPRFVCSPLSSRCRRKLDSNQWAFAIFADSTQMQIKSR